MTTTAATEGAHRSTYFNFSPQSAQSLCHFHWPPMKNKGFSFSGPVILKAKSSEIFKPKICPNFGLLWGLETGGMKSCYFYCKRHILA